LDDVEQKLDALRGSVEQIKSALAPWTTECTVVTTDELCCVHFCGVQSSCKFNFRDTSRAWNNETWNSETLWSFLSAFFFRSRVLFCSIQARIKWSCDCALSQSSSNICGHML
jgi:hypothetical protein